VAFPVAEMGVVSSASLGSRKSIPVTTIMRYILCYSISWGNMGELYRNIEAYVDHMLQTSSNWGTNQPNPS